jgi:hypothetical protein
MVEGNGNIILKARAFDAASVGKLFANINDSEAFCNIWYQNRTIGRSEGMLTLNLL